MGCRFEPLSCTDEMPAKGVPGRDGCLPLPDPDTQPSFPGILPGVLEPLVVTEPAGPQRRLTVIAARYGCDGPDETDKRKCKDVVEAVRATVWQQLDRPRITLRVNSNALGGVDPCPGQSKMLKVWYSPCYGGPIQRMMAAEGDTIVIDQGAAYTEIPSSSSFPAPTADAYSLKIVKAVYGLLSAVGQPLTSNTPGNTDVTSTVQSMVCGGLLRVVASNHDLGGDPCPCEVKALTLWYSFHPGGPIHVAVAQEGQPVEIRSRGERYSGISIHDARLYPSATASDADTNITRDYIVARIAPPTTTATSNLFTARAVDMHRRGSTDSIASDVTSAAAADGGTGDAAATRTRSRGSSSDVLYAAARGRGLSVDDEDAEGVDVTWGVRGAMRPCGSALKMGVKPEGMCAGQTWPEVPMVLKVAFTRYSGGPVETVVVPEGSELDITCEVPPPEWSLVIVKALYGGDQKGKLLVNTFKYNNVTDLIRSMIGSDGRCVRILTVSNDSMQGDPAYGVRKELRVWYTMFPGGPVYHKTVPEDEGLELSV